MPVIHRLWLLALPELARFPVEDQATAIKRAGETELDVFELIGVAGAIVLVTVATQYALVDPSLSSRLAATILNFIVAVPLIGVAATPFHIRRLRRGLRKQLRQLQQQHE